LADHSKTCHWQSVGRGVKPRVVIRADAMKTTATADWTPFFTETLPPSVPQNHFNVLQREHATHSHEQASRRDSAASLTQPTGRHLHWLKTWNCLWIVCERRVDRML